MAKLQMNPDERELTALVFKASIVNHFDTERSELDRQIARVDASVSQREAFNKAYSRVHNFVAKLDAENRADFRLYDSEDRQAVQYTLLFDIFHRYLPDYDNHILEQIDAGDSPIGVAFADEALALFRHHGFSDDESNEWFAIFFQVRRAYFFIERKLVGQSECMREFRKNLWNNVFTYDQLFYKSRLINRMEDFSTLLLGETGTGKGSAASAIGRSGFIPFSSRDKRFADSFTRAFVSINLSQFAEGLIESELFGHRKGAFTGAVEAHEGIFSRASAHGSIFLDEIGEVSVPIQIKLLQLLQDRTFSAVGMHEKRRFKGRVIAATNQDVDRLRRERKFRDDFYYRLCSDIIVVPPLRQRIAEDPGELSDLIDYTIESIVGTPSPELSGIVMDRIKAKLGPAYAWPGNVRELEQCIRRIIIKRDYTGDSTSSADAISLLLHDIEAGSITATSLLAQYCKLLYGRMGTYEAVGQVTGLDRRTAKKYITEA